MSFGERDKKEDFAAFYMQNMRADKKDKNRVAPFFLSMLALVAFASLLWYAYPRGADKYADLNVPIVKADNTQYKFKPDDPGGMVVPHQDSTVFDPLETADKNAVEQILPNAQKEKPKAQLISADKPSRKPENIAKEQPRAKLVKVKPPVAQTGGTEETFEQALAEVTAAQATKQKPKPAKVEGKPKPAVTAKPKPAVSSGSNMRYIQLGSFRSEAQAREQWGVLSSKFKGLISSFNPYIRRADLGEKGIYYRLQIGAFSADKAGEICDKIKAQKPGSCFLVKP